MKKNSVKRNHKPQIICEDENIIAVNKPAGLIVHPAQPEASKPKSLKPQPKKPTLVDWIIKNYPETKKVGDEPKLRPGIVHRLDKDTSGVLIIAKNQKSYEFLKNQFKNRKIKKTYIALVRGVVKNKMGIINTPVKRFSKAREAETEYKVLKKLKNYTLLELSPKTGRTHQIRIHLKSIGHPLVCDKLYTKRPDCPFGLARHFLHAKSIEFTLPGNVNNAKPGPKIKLEADLPKDLEGVLKKLKKIKDCDKNKE